MAQTRRPLFVALLIVSAGWFATYCQPGTGTARVAPTMEDLARQWTYPDSEFTVANDGGGPLRLSTMSVKSRGDYDECLAKIDKFYSEKCGSSANHAEREKIMVFDRAEAAEGGKSLIHTMHMYDRDIIYLFSAPSYTITVLVRPERKRDDVEIILSIAVR